MGILLSLKTHEITTVSSISHNVDTQSPYPDPPPHEKGVMRFSFDPDVKEHTVHEPIVSISHFLLQHNIY